MDCICTALAVGHIYLLDYTHNDNDDGLQLLNNVPNTDKSSDVET